MALSCIALADVSVTPLTDLTWSLGENTTQLDDGTLQFTGTGSTWSVYGSSAALGEKAITLNKDEELTVCYTASITTIDSILTLALVNSNGAVVMGTSYKDDSQNDKTFVRLGTTTETGDAVSRGYAFAGTNNSTSVANIGDYSTLTTNPVVNQEYTLTFKVAYDASQSNFVGTLGYSLGNDTVTVILGESFSVDKHVVTFDGNSTSKASAMSLSVTSIPEPATATLSLLALAGLAARRRRR